MTSRTLRLLPSGQDTNTRRYPRTLAEAFPHGPEYGCAIERPAPRRTRLGVLVCVLLVGIIAVTSARSDLLPDAVEVPVFTRHFQHNDRFNNSTPGLVLQWDTPLAFAGTNAVRAHLGAFKNSNGDPTLYVGLHPEWRIAGPLYAGFGAGLTYGYKELDYSGNAWRDGVPFTQGAVSGRRYETRKVKPAVQLDARLALTRNVSLTAHVVADEKLCKKQPEGLHVTSCAVWLGLRGEW